MSIKVAELAKRYGSGPRATAAVARVDLEVADGEVVALVGPSGCGKSTLLRMIAGLAAPSAGEVLVDGRPVWPDGPSGKPGPDVMGDLALVFQEGTLLPWMSVQDNIALPLRLRGVRRGVRRERAAELCRLVGIDGFEHHRPTALSVGMRQRAALARALAAAPRTLLLDEPFAALDAMTREVMNEELQRVWAAEPCSCLLVTHSIGEAVLLADRVVSLTSRPCTVAAVTEIDFPRPRPLTLQHDPAFQAHLSEIRQLLFEGAP